MAATHDARHLNPHTAADLLHQALMHGGKPHDEEHDQIGSGASTPPNGTATPRPDLTDKRLPGLINSYFAQVRDSLQMSISSTPAPASAPEKHDPSRQDDSSPSRVEGDASTPSMISSTSSLPPPLGMKHTDAYPTPPPSKSPSMLAVSRDVICLDAMAASQAPSPKRASRTESVGKLPYRPRKTSVLPELSQPTVAVHISPSAHSSRTVPASPVGRQSSVRGEESRVLTQSPSQNTPPQTPRSGSHESRRGEEKLHNVPKAAKSDRSDSNGENGATIGQLKGQLEICVEEGRGLRPSIEPYVVCIFQLNEDISGGPKEDEMDTAIDSSSGHGEENLARGVAMKRLGSGSGMAIPGMRSRQTSMTNIADLKRGMSKPENAEVTDPAWRHTTTFDVVGDNNEIDISVYDRSRHEAFLGHIRIPLKLEDYEHQHEDWYKLTGRGQGQENVTGEIHLKLVYHASGKKTFGPDDFEILKLIGKGTFGQVFQVRKRDTKRIYAMKVLSKKVIVQKKEILHTIGERNILVRTATTESPFIVGLKFSFQTAQDLYLVTDYMSGGELFWHLQKEGRFVEERAKFYIAELILALRHLHQHDIVYRDLKPENILLDANGHIALCDFGLSKANLAKNDTTNTFCGTTEYLAPEVLLDEQGYTKMVDFWSLGVLVFEMCCGWSPFYAEDTQQMYKNIAFGKVRFPRDALSQEGRNFVKGLLNRNPSHRLGAKNDAEELMAHPFFQDVDWAALSKKLSQPPFKPKLKSELDTSNFDPEFTNALNGDNASSLNARAAALASGAVQDNTPLSPTMQNQFKGFTFVDESTLEQQYADRNIDETESAARPQVNRDRMSGIEQNGDDFDQGMLEDI